jgi:D-glycero-D-manno-heptose 1,7-bisphosphate phosphatase
MRNNIKAVFLDRDGVINRYPGDTRYVTSWKEFCFLPGVRKALAQLTKHGYKIFVISNQAGVGKGLYSKDDLQFLTTRMLQEIKRTGGNIEKVYYCTHRKEINCSCRKPKIGMITRIRKRYPINIAHTYFLGDTIRDVRTAHAAGCKSILLLSGKEKFKNRKSWDAKPDLVFRNLKEAASFIIQHS